jgi:PAS domain S-box-containing protein
MADATQQLVRYEALAQLLEDILEVDDLAQIARCVATRWKYFANVAGWRLIAVKTDGYLVIDGIRGEATLAEVQELSEWDAYHWSRQRPALLRLGTPTEGGNPPEHLGGRAITEIQVLPLFRAGRCHALISIAARGEPFSELDNKFICLFGGHLANRVSDLLHRRQADRLLRESERRYRSLAENSADWIWTIGVDGQITYTNDRSLELFGLSREEFYETNSASLVHPEDKAMLHEVLSAAVRDKRGWQNVLIRWRTKGGSYREFESNASPIFDENGELVGFQGVDRDVTERKQAEEEREKLAVQNWRLQKMESLSRMAGAIAHHFNNQLAAVMMNMEMVISDLPRHGGPFERLSEGMQSARKAAKVSTQMLTYLGQTTAPREPLDLTTVCQQHLPVIQAALPTDVVMALDLPTPGPLVVASADHVQQILTNLVTNAWEASTGQGTIRVSIKTILAEDIPTEHRFPIDWQPQDTGYACLEVADAGCGIALQDIEKVFDPFFSTKFPGRGLGLSVVLGIVRGQEGVITVESEAGRGSRFRVFLSISAAAVARKPIIATQPSKPAGGGSLLVVEDEPFLRKAAALAFKRLGYTVLTAQDGVEAVEVFQTHQDEISCVLCDLSMPRMNGWETLAALRKLAPGIPVILASGYSETQVLAGEHLELPQAFLSKPYDFEKLKATLAGILGGRLKG